MKWSGTFDMDGLAAHIKQACDAAAEEIADDVLDKARKKVPTDQGELKASGSASSAHTATTSEAAVSFGAGLRYMQAIQQHERMDYAHDDGQAKFLEQPLGEAEDAARKILERHVGQVLE